MVWVVTLFCRSFATPTAEPPAVCFYGGVGVEVAKDADVTPWTVVRFRLMPCTL